MRKKKDSNQDIKNQKVTNELQIFSKEEFGDSRTLFINDKPYFVATLIAFANSVSSIISNVLGFFPVVLI